jgi:hypothetical protein
MADNGVIWTASGRFEPESFDSEADLESAVLQVQADLFGPERIYLPVKRKIGAKGGMRNIPDGYVLDLSGAHPRLLVVENELASHDPLRHIAVQLLQFSLSFEDEQILVKRILAEAISQEPTVRVRCEQYAATHAYSSVDHLLEELVFQESFTALVIIDQLESNLERVLSSRLAFGVEVLELVRYRNHLGEIAYFFTPFLADLDEQREAGLSTPHVDTSEIDTIVVPAQEYGFRETFLNENRWWSVRIHGSMRPRLKYIAAYQVAPVSAITHIAPIASIRPWKDTDKVVIDFAAPAEAIGPISLVKGGRVKAPQNVRYAKREALMSAKTLDDIW